MDNTVMIIKNSINLELVVFKISELGGLFLEEKERMNMVRGIKV